MNKQIEIQNYLKTVPFATIEDILKNVSWSYYHNSHKHLGAILSRMVTHCLISRITRGVFKFNKNTDVPIRQLDPKQTSMFDNAKFNGSDYIPLFDDERLTGQIKRVYSIMIDGVWRTLSDIEKLTSDPQASISAQLRNLRKPRFGSHTLNKRNRGERENGLFEYQLLKPKK